LYQRYPLGISDGCEPEDGGDGQAVPLALLERDDFVDADGRPLSASTATSAAHLLLSQRDAAQVPLFGV